MKRAKTTITVGLRLWLVLSVLSATYRVNSSTDSDLANGSAATL